MIQFSEKDLYYLVKEILTPQYYKWGKIQQIYELDDLVNEAILWYYQPMKNGEQRLSHYLNTCESEKHFVNLVRLSLSQFIPGLFRINAVKYHPSSLNRPMDGEEDSRTEFIDLIEDHSESLYSKTDGLSLLDIFTSEEKQLVKDLVETGYEEEKFRLAKFEQKTERAIKSRVKGIDLHLKYENYDILLRGIKQKIRKYYRESGDALSNHFITRKEHSIIKQGY